MIKEAIESLIESRGLSQQEMQLVMEEIMSGSVNNSQIAAFLTALKIKKETPDEITGAALTMRKFVTRITIDKDVILDTCGTGGDCSGTFNISTISAFVVAGAGLTVAKHGNRSVSSRCGSADLLEALGVNINMEVAKLENCLGDIGIGFLFAQNLHPAMKFAAPVRKELGFRTIFNILGPLTNPAAATHQLLGVYDEGLLKTMAEVLKNLNLIHAVVVHGMDGLDEVTTTTDTKICEVKNGRISSYKISPKDFGVKKAKLDDLKGGDLNLNVDITRSILSGEKSPQRDIVVLNAATAIYVADRVKSIKEGMSLAQDSIDSGKASDKLESLVGYSKSS